MLLTQHVRLQTAACRLSQREPFVSERTICHCAFSSWVPGWSRQFPLPDQVFWSNSTQRYPAHTSQGHSPKYSRAAEPFPGRCNYVGAIFTSDCVINHPQSCSVAPRGPDGGCAALGRARRAGGSDRCGEQEPAHEHGPAGRAAVEAWVSSDGA